MGGVYLSPKIMPRPVWLVDLPDDSTDKTEPGGFQLNSGSAA